MTELSSSMVIIEPVINDNELILPEKTDGLTLAHYLPVLQQYREINAALVFDYRDKKGNAAARSHVAKLRKIKAPLGEIHKRLKGEYLAITVKMDADKRYALAVVEDMIEQHDKELRIVAAEESAALHKKKVESEIIDCWELAHEMNAMVDSRRELERQVLEQSRIAKEQAEEQRRLAAEKDKIEAIAKAAEEARLAEQARSAHAIEEAKQRELAAKEEACRKIREAEIKAEREKKDTEAIAKAPEDSKIMEDKRARDLENLKRVHGAIILAMANVGVSEDRSKALILAIKGGQIPAVSIDYKWKPVSYNQVSA